MTLKLFVLVWFVLCSTMERFSLYAASKTDEASDNFMSKRDDIEVEMERLSGNEGDRTKGQEEFTSRYRRELRRPIVDRNSSLASPESSRNHTESSRNNTESSRNQPESSRNQICPERLSCRNNCSTPRLFIRHNQLSCFCDKDCMLFKDCCADFEQYCSSNKSEVIEPNNLITTANKNLWQCFEGDKVKGIDRFWMIGSCPQSWPKDDIFFQCIILSASNTITKDNYQYLPVYTSDGTVYHNRFCAQCNGVNSKDLGEYKLRFGCSIVPPSAASREKTIDFLFNHCESNNIYWIAPDGAPRRFCLSLEETDGYGCRRDVEGKCTNGSYGIVSILEKHANYKNKHCADLCGGRGSYPCGPLFLTNAGGGLQPVPPFSIIFDFKDSKKDSKVVKVDCPFNHFYDPFLQTCRLGRSTIPKESMQTNHQQFEVLLWMKPSVPLNFQMMNKIRSTKLDTKTTGEVLNIREEQLSKCNVDVLSSSLLTLKFNLNISLGQNRTRSRRSLQITNDHYVERITNFASPFQLTYFSYNFTVFKVTKRILSCPNLQTYKRNEYTVSSKDGSAVVIIKTKEELKSGNFYTVNGTKPEDSEAIFICRAHIFTNCSGKWILRHEGEFIVLENKSIFINSSNKVSGSSSYVWVNHSVYVCENISKSYYKQSQTQDSILVILTYICLITSIVCLVYVLITYSLFTELRTPPGINLMNLSASILLAQFLWLFGSGQTDRPMACTAIAVLLHYLFLVSFAWTSIIAFDTWRAFTAKGARPRADSKRKRILHSLKYMAFGWLLPVLYVTVCVILDTSKTFNIGYQTRSTIHGACWMSNPKAVLFFMAIPVGFLLTLNFFLYVLTLKAITSSTAQARAATEHKERKRNFWIYIRIASVMGFTWIIGFAVPFGGKVLLYIFIILNCLQGLYIALAFGINQRVRSLYKNRFPIFARSSNAVTSDATKSTSRFEKLPETMETKL